MALSYPVIPGREHRERTRNLDMRARFVKPDRDSGSDRFAACPE
jgi:hypothetical protein